MNRIEKDTVLKSMLADERQAGIKPGAELKGARELTGHQHVVSSIRRSLLRGGKQADGSDTGDNSMLFQSKNEVPGRRTAAICNDLLWDSQALICTHDMKGNVLSANPALCKLLQYSKDDLVGRKVAEFMPENRRAEFTDKYMAEINRNNSAQGVLCLLSSTGEKVYTLYQNYKAEEKGRDAIVISVSQNITGRILLQHERVNSKRISEETRQAKETFLANLSHEIRTPMNGILGIAGLLGKTELNDRQQNFLKLIQESANNLLVIVNDVLDLEKIAAGKLQLEKIPFKIVDKVAIIVQSFIYRAEEKGLAIIYQNAIPGDLVVIGDPFRLSQVFNNILSNAIKFTEKGNIIISTRIKSFKNENAFIEFNIKDTGIGITEEKMKKIFEPFEQANSSISRKYGGTGLGLSICKNLVEMLGGSLYAESEENKGSTFTFTLPYFISEEQIVEVESTTDIDYSSLGRKKILLAEDLELNQFIAKHIMETWGFEVDIACDGLQALDMVKKNTYDLVLMDIQMPGMDGIAATMEIRNLSDPAKANIPIVALTAHALKSDSEKYRAAGMNDYLSKPFQEAGLFQVIARSLRNGEGGPAVAAKNRPSQTQQPVIIRKLYDLSVIRAVSGGDEDFVTKMIQLFIETVPVCLKELNSFIDEENWEMVSKTAHKLKSTIDSMGIHSLREDVRIVERTAKKKEGLQNIYAIVQNLNTTVDECIKQLETEILGKAS